MSNYFGQNHLEGDFFASNHFGGAAVPAPVPAAAGTMSTFGGGPWMHAEKTYVQETEEEFNRYLLRRSLGGKHARRKNLNFAKGLGSKLAKDIQNTSQSLRTKERKNSAGKVDGLRRKLRKYKGEIQKLHKKLAGRDGTLMGRVETVSPVTAATLLPGRNATTNPRRAPQVVPVKISLDENHPSLIPGSSAEIKIWVR